MPDWNDIFTKKGKVFTDPHPDMERLTEIFKERNVKTILDLGCGTGRHLIFFAKKGFKIYGFDASPKALEIAGKWLAEEFENVELCHHIMEKPFPYEDNFFDAVISIQVIHHNLKKDIMFTVKEIERILKCNGIIFITFPFLIKGSYFDKKNLKKVEKGTYIPQEGPERGLAHHFFTLGEIHKVFSSFNLLEIEIDKTDHRAVLGVKK